jgi:tRNA(Glu) U13 pseudouridine synthase TruD
MMKYSIKQKPEDFIVNEIFSPKLSNTGQYVYLRLKKTNYNTLDAIKRISEASRIPLKNFGFAGSKDRKAVTTQIISVFTKNESKIYRLKTLNLKDIEIGILGKSEKPVSLGDHEGNEFVITVRNLDSVPEKISTRFVNYFGEQRFSTNNVGIGRAIIKKDFQKACELIGRQEISMHLTKYPNDCIGALNKLPKKLVSLFIHSYQSDVWNRVVDKTDADEFSTPGFGSEYPEAVQKLVNEELEKDKIRPRDFVIRQLPNIYTEGKLRKKYAEAEDFEILEKADDELNPNKKKLRIRFRLRKGSYATVFIESIFAGA